MSNKAYHQKYFQDHKAIYRDRHRKLRRERRNKGLCTECGESSKTYLCRICYDKGKLLYMIKYRQKVRDEVFRNYGGATCSCCGETERDFLTIDHINEDGARHRREVVRSGAFYQWLKSHNFPPGFQVLCWNCNHSKHFHGECVHKRRVKQS
jgi:hypothetical protein